MQSQKKIKVLFLCTGNSCRSQMAEGWARHLKNDVIESFSAGVEIHSLNEQAVKVMAEAGVDIAGHRSKHVNELQDVTFDYVITVCNNADEACPVFPGKVDRLHISFNDPPKMAAALAKQGATTEEQLACYRKVRDEIKIFIESMPAVLKQNEGE